MLKTLEKNINLCYYIYEKIQLKSKVCILRLYNREKGLGWKPSYTIYRNFTFQDLLLNRKRLVRGGCNVKAINEVKIIIDKIRWYHGNMNPFRPIQNIDEVDFLIFEK